jgi:EAL domain-containing protein (putative c-di-GMP-specific phosphodiesterase class I)
LSEERLVDNILTLIKQQAIDPQRICFEITETAAITNLVNARQFIDALRKYGFRFALDDFGSGLSSFEYLKNLPVDYLKIDGSFVRDMANNRIDHAMVAAINQVGHIMDIKTIAEFVENDQIIHKLQLLNVDYAQGYGISRPQPIEDIVYETMAMQRSNINRRVAAS